MQSKLRELAERWLFEADNNLSAVSPARVAKLKDADELLYILDAEGDGGAVGEVVRNESGQIYLKFADGKTIADFMGSKLYTQPARSGGVSDADVSDVAKMIADRVGNGMREKYEMLAKQILTNLAKRPEVGGMRLSKISGTKDALSNLSIHKSYQEKTS